MTQVKDTWRTALAITMLSACQSFEPLPSGQTLSIELASDSRDIVSVADSVRGENTTVGAMGGAGAGFAAGLAVAAGCGPLAIACAFFTVPVGMGVGAGGGAVVASSFPTSNRETADRLRQVLTDYMQGHDSQSAMLTMLRSRAREHWKVVASPATTNMRMEITAVSFQLQDEQHVSFKMLARASIDWTDSDRNARRWLHLPEYTSPQLDAKTWTTDQSPLDEHLQRAYSKIADDIVAALRKEPESSKALLQKLPR